MIFLTFFLNPNHLIHLDWKLLFITLKNTTFQFSLVVHYTLRKQWTLTSSREEHKGMTI